MTISETVPIQNQGKKTLRYRLIKLLAGKRIIIMNVKLEGPGFKFDLGDHYGMLENNCFVHIDGLKSVVLKHVSDETQNITYPIRGGGRLSSQRLGLITEKRNDQ